MGSLKLLNPTVFQISAPKEPQTPYSRKTAQTF